MKKIVALSLYGVCAGLLAGCQSLDQALNKADRALAITKSPTAQMIAGIAEAKDPEAALRVGLKRRAALYERNPQALIADIRTVKRDYDNLVCFQAGKVNTNGARRR